MENAALCLVHDARDPETDQRYTVKRYESEKIDRVAAAFVARKYRLSLSYICLSGSECRR
jgi:hypothetical protein